MSANQPALKVSQLKKKYDTRLVFSDLSFEARSGDVVFLLGANGTGKSSLLKILVGLESCDQGSIEYAGETTRPLKEISFLGSLPGFYNRLTTVENFEFFSSLYQGGADWREYAAIFKLDKSQTDLAGNLSKGQEARLSLALALIKSPRYLFLDEPTANLDQDGVSCFVQALKHQQSTSVGQIIVIATHDLERISGLANRVLILSETKLILDEVYEFEKVKFEYSRVNR